MGFILESFSIEFFILIIVSLMSYAYIKVKDSYCYFEKRGMEYEPGSFPFGSTWNIFLSKMSFGESLDVIYKKFPNKSYVPYFLGMRPTILIRDPELVQKIIIKDFSSFHDRGFKIDEKVNPLEGNLFKLNGRKWKTLRVKLTPTFTSGKLKWMFDLMNESGDGLIEMLNEVSDNKDRMFKEFFARYTTDIIASCAFGIEGQGIKDPDCEFRKMSKQIFKSDLMNQFKTLFRILLPNLSMKLKMKTLPKDVNDFFINITKQGLKYRRETGIQRNDFLQLLLELTKKRNVEFNRKDIQVEDEFDNDEEKLDITDELLAAQTFIFFVAGFENSSSTMAFAAYFLSKYPKIQDEVRTEIRSVKKKYGSLTYEGIRELKLLEACINETLRLFPPGEVILRKCNSDFDLGDGHKIEKNMSISIPLWSLQRDPNIFPEPETFKPERFLNDNYPAPGTYLPFGDGPRVCIAKKFAMLEIKIGMVKLLENFRLNYSDKTIEPIRYKPGSFQEPRGGLWMKLEKIQNLI